MLTFILGLNRDLRRMELLKSITANCDAGREGMYLVVPEETTFVSERDLQVHLGDRTSRHIEVVGLDKRLHTRIHAAIGQDVECMDDGGRILTMATAMNMVRKDLICYKQSASRPEFIQQALNTCEMLLKNDVDPAVIADTEGASEGLRKKAEDISLIMKTYLALCDNAVLDPSQEEFRLPSAILEYGSKAFRNTYWYVDGYSEFTASQASILAALFTVSAGMTICLPCESADDMRESSAGAVASIKRLQKRIPEELWKVDYVYTPSISMEHPALSILQSELCSSIPAKPHKVEGTTQHVRLFIDPTPYDEIRHIAGTILQAVRSKDETKRVRYRDISVVLPDYQRYAPVVERVFEEYGIPAYFASRTSGIDDMPVMQAVLAALDAVTRGYPTLEVVQYIKSGLANISMDEADILESYALTWAIRGKGWTPEEGWKMHPGGWGREFTDEDNERLAAINALREKAVAPLLELGNTLKAAGTAGECAIAVNAFLTAIDFQTSLQHIVDGLVEAGDRQTAKEYAQVNELICNALEQLYGSIGDVEVTQPADFAKMFRLICGTYRIDTIPTTLEQVMVFDLVDARHICSKIRYIAGCSDGVFPSYEASGNSFILSPADAEEIEKLELGTIPGAPQDTVNRQLADINSCISGAKRGLILSYSYGNETTPSPLYIRAQQLLPELTPTAGCGADGIYQADLLQAKACGRLLGRINTKPQYSEIAMQLALVDNEEKEDVAWRVWDKADWAGLSNLSEETIRKLYGDVIPLTASRSEAFASCRYFFFLRYGLGLKEPPTGRITSPVFGSFAHAVLEGSFREIEARGGFKAVPMSTVMDIARKHIEKYTKEKLQSLESQSERYRYMYQRDCGEIIGVLNNLCKEFVKSEFHAKAFEMKIGGEGADIPAIYYKGERMTGCYTGIIDRVDGAEDIEGKDYYRIMDYKTGTKKTYDLSDMLMGLSLQLILYNAAIKKVAPDTDSAGMLYVPAKETITTFRAKPDDDEVEKAKKKEASRTGVVLNDPAVIDAMEHSDNGTLTYLPVKYAKDGTVTGSVVSAEQIQLLNEFGKLQMSKLVDNIASGDITANPLRRGPQRDACQYCFAKGACHKDTCGTKFRYRARVTDDEFWTEVQAQIDRAKASA